jgi:hypothetical protein
MYKTLNQIESVSDWGDVLFIGFMTSPKATSSARDDKGKGSASIWCDGSNDNLTGVVHFSLYLPQASWLLGRTISF